MTASVVAALASGCIAMTGLIGANLFVTAMIGELNRKRRSENQIAYFGFTPWKTLRIFSEYRASYPAGRLHLYAWFSFAIAVAALLVVAVMLQVVG